jgi:hypothetical protein
MSLAATYSLPFLWNTVDLFAIVPAYPKGLGKTTRPARSGWPVSSLIRLLHPPGDDEKPDAPRKHEG